MIRGRPDGPTSRGSEPMSNRQTRRTFLGQGVGAIGLLGLACRPGGAWAFEASNPDEMIAKAVAFLRPRQAEDGSWSGTRKEPGITALVVTAMLRSKRVTPTDPIATRALAYLERFLGPKGGLSEA